jgi:hypothetical protein
MEDAPNEATGDSASDAPEDSFLWHIADGYVERIENELGSRWRAWVLDMAHVEMYEVLGGLMARQTTLASHLAFAPSIWNGHIAPIILRAMTDVYITFAWIWKKPVERSRMYIYYGLGQEKLQLEHLKAQIERSGGDPAKSEVVQVFEAWLNAQRFTFLTEVNVGSWSGTDTRRMAEEAGCIELYRFAYAPFSQATHSMWPHVLRYNLRHCTNPLHRLHRVPGEADVGLDADYLYRAAKYVKKMFDLFDRATGVRVDAPSGFRFLVEQFDATEESNDDVSFEDEKAE